MAVWTAYRDGREDAMNKTPFILLTEQIGEFWTEERCYITELINDPKMPAFSLAIARVEPAVTRNCAVNLIGPKKMTPNASRSNN